MKSSSNLKGFTLVELMVTVAIMGIMAAIALPNMNSFVKKSRLTNRADQVANLFRYAKGEAVRTGIPVVICGDTIRSDGRPNGRCNPNVFDNANNASNNNGIKAFLDKNLDRTYKASDDTDLRTISINGDSNTKYINLEVKYCGLTTGCTNAKNPKQMTFNPNGQFGVQNNNKFNFNTHYVQFLLADKSKANDSAYRLYVVISPSGNVATCNDDGTAKQLCGL